MSQHVSAMNRYQITERLRKGKQRKMFKHCCLAVIHKDNNEQTAELRRLPI